MQSPTVPVPQPGSAAGLPTSPKLFSKATGDGEEERESVGAGVAIERGELLDRVCKGDNI